MVARSLVWWAGSIRCLITEVVVLDTGDIGPAVVNKFIVPAAASH